MPMQTSRPRSSSALTSFLDIQQERLAAIGPELTEQVQAARDATSGGKRLRPSFCYWGFRAAGGDPDAADPEGRGEPGDAARQRPGARRRDGLLRRTPWGPGRAPAVRGAAAEPGPRSRGAAVTRSGSASARPSCSGDLCLIWADEMLHTSGFDAAALARASKFFDAVRVEVTAGQYLDLVAQASGEADMDRALRVLRYKSRHLHGRAAAAHRRRAGRWRATADRRAVGVRAAAGRGVPVARRPARRLRRSGA